MNILYKSNDITNGSAKIRFVNILFAKKDFGIKLQISPSGDIKIHFGSINFIDGKYQIGKILK